MDRFDAFGVELMGFWVAMWTLPNIKKNFKSQSLTGKVLPDFRDKPSVELALNSLVLGPSPFFCFKLSYNDFDFYLIIFHSIDRPFL